MALSDQQLRHLERRLHEERKRALDIIRRFDEQRDASPTAADGDITDYPFHVADQGTDSYDQEITVTLVERASRELEEIDDALERLYEHPDRFGLSETTGKPIPFERLDLIPWARTAADEPDPSS